MWQHEPIRRRLRPGGEPDKRFPVHVSKTIREGDREVGSQIRTMLIDANNS